MAFYDDLDPGERVEGGAGGGILGLVLLGLFIAFCLGAFAPEKEEAPQKEQTEQATTKGG